MSYSYSRTRTAAVDEMDPELKRSIEEVVTSLKVERNALEKVLNALWVFNDTHRQAKTTVRGETKMILALSDGVGMDWVRDLEGKGNQYVDTLTKGSSLAAFPYLPFFRQCEEAYKRIERHIEVFESYL